MKDEIGKGLGKINYSNLGRADEDIEAGKPVSNEKYDDVVISITPDLSLPSYDPKPIPDSCHQTRTDEILLWLHENAELDMDIQVRKNVFEVTRKHAEVGDIYASKWLLPEEKRLHVKNFVCLDDMNLHYYSCYRLKAKIKDHLVQTRTSSGLLPKHVKEAVKVLNNKEFDFMSWASNCFVNCDKNACFHKQTRAEKERMDILKRSSLNMGLEIPVNRKKTAPARLGATRNSLEDREKVQRADSGYDCVL